MPDGEQNFEQDGDTERPQYSPLVRRLAEEFEVDLSDVEGTGPGGRITRADVQAVAFPGTEPAATRPTEADEPEVAGPRSTFSLTIEVDAAQLQRTHERLASRAGRTLGLDALLLSLVAVAMADEPSLTAGHGDQAIGFLRVGDDGMVADVVTDVDDLSLTEIDLQMDEVVRRHQPGDEPIVAPLTILDAGALGVASASSSALPAGGVAMVCFGRPRDGAAMTVSATFDEQVIDLSRAAGFLNRLSPLLEDPIIAFAH